MGQVVVAAGDDDVRRQPRQPVQVELPRVGLFQRFQGLRQGRVEVFLVAHRRLAGGGHDLRLVAVRKDVGQVVGHHVFGLGRDGRPGLQVGLAGAVPQDLQALLEVVVAEDVRKGRVHARLIGHFGVVGPALVDDLQGHAVVDGLAHGVFVDVVAEDPLRLVDGRPGVADPGGVGDALVEVRPEHGVLGAVGLVGHDQDVGAPVQLREGLRQFGFAELVDHGHDQVRGVGPEEFLELLDAVGHLDRKADALAGLGKLALQLGPVRHEDHLPVREPGVAVHLPHHEHHGQGFSRALGVPDDAAPLPGALAFEEALHRQLDGAELLVAPHDLDRLALVVRRKEGEGADQVQEVVAVEHPGDEALLVVGAAAAVGDLVHRPGIGIGPAVEVLLAVGRDGAELGLVPAGGDDDLVVVEEGRAALALGAALLAVAEQLVDGLGDGVLDLGRLALDHPDGQAVQEQDDVRDDVVLRPQDAHLELADGDEAVVGSAVEVHEPHRRALLAGLAVDAHARVFQEQREDVAVVLDQIGPGEARRELLDRLLHLIVLQPGVDDLEPLPQHRQHDDLGEALPEGVAGVLLAVEVDDLPAQPGQLIEEGLLDVVAFVELDVRGRFVLGHQESFPFNRCTMWGANCIIDCGLKSIALPRLLALRLSLISWVVQEPNSN